MLSKDGLDQCCLGRLLTHDCIPRLEVLDAPGAALVVGVIYVLRRAQLGLMTHQLSHVPDVQADGLPEARYFVLLLDGEWVQWVRGRERWELVVLYY